MKKTKKVKLIIMLLFSVIIMFAILLGYLYYFGVLQINNPSVKKYPVRGVDVSSYQGDIDWKIISAQNIQFAFIKATEGSTFVDPNFSENYAESKKTDLRIGAYHFFSFDSEGLTQAQNFISNVEKINGMLPPVVDFEFYGDKEKNLPDKEMTREQLNVFLTELEEQYGMKPIIYATQKSYNIYLNDGYEEYDLWIRSVYGNPKAFGNHTWTFWQYSNRKRLKGYVGEEVFIDMNVFNGSLEEFMRYPKK